VDVPLVNSRLDVPVTDGYRHWREVLSVRIGI